MQVYFGMESVDATGMRYTEGKVYQSTFESIDQITAAKALELLKEGYLAVKVKNTVKNTLHQLPINILASTEKLSQGWMTGATPNFFLANDGKLKYAVINGYLVDLENPKSQEFKQRVL
jgi:thioredoxin-related protein